MTKDDVLKIIQQNKDLLTPENYQGVIKRIDVFTEEEKQKIVDYLQMAQEMLKANQAYVKAQNALLEKTGDQLKEIDEKIVKDTKTAYKKAEESEKTQESDEAENLLSNL